MVRKITLPSFFFNNNSQILRRESGSKPVVGSSKKIYFGLPIVVILIQSLHF